MTNDSVRATGELMSLSIKALRTASVKMGLSLPSLLLYILPSKTLKNQANYI
jgi:hypothetical protein